MEILAIVLLVLVVGAVIIPTSLAAGRRRRRRERTDVHHIPSVPSTGGVPSWSADDPPPGSAPDRARHGRP